MPAFTSSQLSAFRTRARDLHNWWRINERGGRVRLELSSTLNSSAQAWAQKMAQSGNFAHGGYGGCGANSCGQNIAKGQTTVDAACVAWRKSCAHYYNMVNGYYNRMGLGAYKANSGTVYWAVHFSGSRSYCTGCSSGCSFCCACANCSSWKNTDPYRQ